MSAPKVSVLVPVYNVSRYLPECLNSLISQSLKEIEFICLNDGSTDDSLKILQEYAARDSRIKIVDKPNSGYGHTLNTGLDLATGEYIGIIDSDDYILPDMYQTLYQCAHDNDLDFVKSNISTFTSCDGYNEINVLPLSTNKTYYNRILSPLLNKEILTFPMHNVTGIYKRSFLNGNNVRLNETPGASYQDTGFHFQVFCLARRIMFLDESFYMYRIDNPESSINNPNKTFVSFEEHAFIEKFLNLHPELKNNFVYIHNLIKFRNLIWRYDRIMPACRKAFLNRISHEFKQSSRNNELNLSVFMPYERKILKKIMRNPFSYYYWRPLHKLSRILKFIGAYFTFPIYVYKIYKKL